MTTLGSPPRPPKPLLISSLSWHLASDQKSIKKFLEAKSRQAFLPNDSAHPCLRRCWRSGLQTGRRDRRAGRWTWGGRDPNNRGAIGAWPELETQGLGTLNLRSRQQAQTSCRQRPLRKQFVHLSLSFEFFPFQVPTAQSILGAGWQRPLRMSKGVPQPGGPLGGETGTGREEGR